MNHSYVDPGLRCIGQSFVVLAQPTAPAEPRECSFNHPSSRQHLKVVAVPGALDNLERPACQGPDPLDQLSIGPDMRGNRPINLSMTSFAPSLSWILAGCTTTASSNPMVSTMMCRFRPLTFLPAS